MGGGGGGGEEGGAYAASFGQRVAAVSRKCALARLLQLVVAGLLDDGFKSCLHAQIERNVKHTQQQAKSAQVTSVSRSSEGELLLQTAFIEAQRGYP